MMMAINAERVKARPIIQFMEKNIRPIPDIER
jgi:hypothetical protein